MREKTSAHEIESINNLVTMSVYFTIADCLGLDAMDLHAEDHLENDLGMSDSQKQALAEAVMTQFDGEILDFSGIFTVQNIIDQLVTYRGYRVLH